MTERDGPGQPEQRRHDRVAMTCDVEFKRHAGSPYAVDLVDFSATGCRLAPPIRVQLGEAIWLRIPALEPIHGRIAWVEEWQAGVAFDRPIHPAVFDSIVARLNAS